MKHFFKGAAVVAGVTIVMLIINIIINIVCNKNGIDLNATVQCMTSTLIGAFAAMAIYSRWFRDEK